MRLVQNLGQVSEVKQEKHGDLCALFFLIQIYLLLHQDQTAIIPNRTNKRIKRWMRFRQIQDSPNLQQGYGSVLNQQWSPTHFSSASANQERLVTAPQTRLFSLSGYSGLCVISSRFRWQAKASFVARGKSPIQSDFVWGAELW